MRISFSVPASKRPSGGPMVMYSLANALCRAGHDITVIHCALFGGEFNEVLTRTYPRDLDEIDYIGFEDGIDHRFLPNPYEVVDELPDAEFMFQSEEHYPARCGRRVRVITGARVFAPERERPLLESDGLKVCLSRWLVDVMVEHGTDPDDIVQIPMGLDHVALPPDEPTERVYDVAMAYSEWPTKGAEAGIAALSEVRESHPDLSVVLFGSSEMVHLMPPWMTYAERLPPDRLASDIYCRSHILLNPSRTEGYGLTSVEAMACGAALVTTANGGSAEFAFHGDTALVVDDGTDVAAMARAIDDLVDNRDRCAEIAERGKKLARSLNWDAAAATLEGFLAPE